MPNYEYECTKCKFRFEELQKFTDPPLVQCPKCKGKLRRLISGGTGLIFKGSGFYVTDYKNSKMVAAPKPKKDLPPKEEKKELPQTAEKSKVPAKK